MHDGSEVGSLAAELARAYTQAVAFYRQQYGLTLEEADAQAREPASAEYRAWLLDAPPDQLSWSGLSTLMERDPEAAQAAWQRVKQAARDQLGNGYRAALVMEGISSAWDRARFLAIRDAFINEWQPAGGFELALIDMLAQTYSAYLFWLEDLQIKVMTESSMRDHALATRNEWEPPRLSRAEAIAEAAAMVDRFNRLFLRTVRALRDFRRYAPGVTIQSAQQVNIGAQQVNAAGDVHAGR